MRLARRGEVDPFSITAGSQIRQHSEAVIKGARPEDAALATASEWGGFWLPAMDGENGSTVILTIEVGTLQSSSLTTWGRSRGVLIPFPCPKHYGKGIYSHEC